MDHIKNIEKLGKAMNAANDRVNELIDVADIRSGARGKAFDAALVAEDAFRDAVRAARAAGVQFTLRLGSNYEFRKVIAL